MDGPFWITRCGNLNFTVATDASVRVWGDVPYTPVGTSQTLMKVLEEYRPLVVELAQDDVLQLALEALEDCNDG